MLIWFEAVNLNRSAWYIRPLPISICSRMNRSNECCPGSYINTLPLSFISFLLWDGRLCNLLRRLEVGRHLYLLAARELVIAWIRDSVYVNLSSATCEAFRWEYHRLNSVFILDSRAKVDSEKGLFGWYPSTPCSVFEIALLLAWFASRCMRFTASTLSARLVASLYIRFTVSNLSARIVKSSTPLKY